VHVVTAYQLALVMGLLPSAALGESVGHQRVYAAGVALFTTASALCSFAPSLTFLVAARFLQGLGGAAIMSLGVALLRHILPERDLGRAIGWNALVVALASAAGPTVGATVLSVASWPWLFAVNLPLGALILFLTRSLPRVAGTARKLDLVSIALNGAVFAALVLGLESLPESPGLAAILVVIGGSLATTLVRRELPRVAPLVPFDLLRQGSFRISVLASICCFIGQSMAMVSLPFYLLHELAQDALHTGLLITPWPLTVALVAPLSARLANRVSGAWLCVLGATLLAVGLCAAALWRLRGNPSALVPIVALCGAGFGIFQVANNRSMLLSAPPQRSGAAGGMQATARLTGQTIGGVLMSLLFTVSSSALAPRIGLAAAACATLAAALVSTQRSRWG
jgi:DHA2 family multidrug resistance protein-like MFS transporter